MDFELDVSTWRCGDRSAYALGEGSTRLLNKEGYMCCLGQLSKQCMDVSDKDILNKVDPECIFTVGNGLVHTDDTVLVSKIVDRKTYPFHYSNTDLTREAMIINDNEVIDNKTRIYQLKELFKTYGHTLTVINDHLLEENV